ncbi:MAG: hypothetical protein PQJ58_13445 [Spirochaetales bacterium]|nr:hypothetical protein [Spirochaetales bacterium]
MKKLIWLVVAAALCFAFVSCDQDSGPSMNEAYAGTWYGYNYDLDLIKSEMTDSTYEDSFWNGEEFVSAAKGTIKKVAEGEIDLQMTEIYLSTDIMGDSFPAADEGWYSKEKFIDWGIENGYWTNEAGMIDLTGMDFESVTYKYELLAEGTMLTLTSNDDSYAFTSVNPVQ